MITYNLGVLPLENSNDMDSFDFLLDIATGEDDEGRPLVLGFLILEDLILPTVLRVDIVGELGLAELALDVRPLIGEGSQRLTGFALLVQPLHETLHVDLTHRP